MKHPDLPEAVHDIIPSVVSVVFRRYKNYVDRDDLLQEAYAWAYPKTATITEWLMESDPEKLKQAERRLGWQIKRTLERYCRKEKAVKSGYQVADEAYYETYTIAQLLEFVLKAIETGMPFEQGQQMIDDGLPKRPSAPAESGNLIAMLIDIKKNYLLLDEKDRTLLRQRYLDEMTLAQMAQFHERSISTVDRWCENALRHLQDKLGGQSPWA